MFLRLSVWRQQNLWLRFLLLKDSYLILWLRAEVKERNFLIRWRHATGMIHLILVVVVAVANLRFLMIQLVAAVRLGRLLSWLVKRICGLRLSMGFMFEILLDVHKSSWNIYCHLGCLMHEHLWAASNLASHKNIFVFFSVLQLPIWQFVLAKTCLLFSDSASLASYWGHIVDHYPKCT